MKNQSSDNQSPEFTQYDYVHGMKIVLYLAFLLLFLSVFMECDFLNVQAAEFTPSPNSGSAVIESRFFMTVYGEKKHYKVTCTLQLPGNAFYCMVLRDNMYDLYYYDLSSDDPALLRAGAVERVHDQYALDGGFSSTNQSNSTFQMARWTVEKEVEDPDAYVVSTDIPFFDSLQSANAYIQSGDTSGLVFAPDINWDTEKDYTDAYDVNMPVPELTNLSYVGFTVSNAQEGMYLDVVVDSYFYGVKHHSDTNGLIGYIPVLVGLPSTARHYYVANPSWKIGTHHYNFTNSEKVYDDANVRFSEMFGVNVLGDLVDDFKSWSAQYPTHKKLPDYSYFNHSASDWNTRYNSNHNYNTSEYKSSDHYCVRNSGQACMVYSVRFFTSTEEGVKYGKWIRYKWSGDGTVTVGDIPTLPGGEIPSPDSDSGISNPETGKQDDDGNIDYGNGIDFDFSSPTNLVQMFTSLFGNLNTLQGQFGQFSAFLTSAFAFIPFWIWLLIGCAFSLSIITMVIKILRGM